MDIMLTPRSLPKFGSLIPGDVFLGEGTKGAYMKIAPVSVPGSMCERNVVRLRDGALYTFTDGSTVVVPKKVKLNIEE